MLLHLGKPREMGWFSVGGQLVEKPLIRMFGRIRYINMQCCVVFGLIF